MNKKKKDGSLIIRITTDRKFNILLEETTRRDEAIDHSELVAYLAKKYIKTCLNIRKDLKE